MGHRAWLQPSWLGHFLQAASTSRLWHWHREVRVQLPRGLCGPQSGDPQRTSAVRVIGDALREIMVVPEFLRSQRPFLGRHLEGKGVPQTSCTGPSPGTHPGLLGTLGVGSRAAA